MSDEMSSAYDPMGVESRWYETWRKQGSFSPAADAKAPVYTVVLPPPNVTGRLHMGHALTATIQDCMIRWKRMCGYAALWLPGTDHAGIATQVMVERELGKEGTDRLRLGREQFLQRVWAWKEEHGGIIDKQHEALGASLDWSRYRFTMDDVSSRAVREAFCRLYEQGLIYRAYRLINWDWGSQTALSDLEVEHREVKGKLWHFAYPVEGTSERLVIATTRPETMLGDTAVAVHPEDPRYKHLIGKRVVLPLTGRTIPIVGDSILVDMEFGTGAVKVTPAHDFNDFETGKRHDLEVICILDTRGRINDNAPERFRGLDVQAARAAVVEALEAEGLVVEIEDHEMAIGFSQRSGVIVEPMPSTQWFVSVESMAKQSLEAVRAKKTRFIPENRTQDFYRWMENLRDWCISRQLWWGHRIPAWYCDDCGHVTVSRTDVERCEACPSSAVRQDEDVLDTWFSSGLWPLTTLGWPDETRDLERFYPTSLMETGWDILPFWVARMMMFGLHFRNEVPFREVFLHSMVLGEDGQKMSKTRGNVVDPIDLIERYGADSLRFYLCTMAGQELGIVFSQARVEGYRNFCNKLWNAARFTRMNVEGYEPGAFIERVFARHDISTLSSADLWILARTIETCADVDTHLASYRLDLAAHAAYQFVWRELCDWYIELAKSQLRSADEHRVHATRGVLTVVFDVVVRLLHPMIPFITEELRTHLPKPPGSAPVVIVDTYPQVLARDPSGRPTRCAGYLGEVEALLAAAPTQQAKDDMQRVMEVVTSVRGLKAQFKLSPAQPVVVQVRAEGVGGAEMVERIAPAVTHLARLERLEVLGSDAVASSQSATEIVRGLEVFLPLAGLIDIDAERARMQKEFDKRTQEIESLRRKLGNESFCAKAPAHVVQKERERLQELRVTTERLQATLQRLASSA